MLVWSRFLPQQGGDTSWNARISRAAQSMPLSDQPTRAKSARHMFPMKPSASGIFIDTSSMWKPVSFAGNVTAMVLACRLARDAPHAVDVRDRSRGSSSPPTRNVFSNGAVPKRLELGRGRPSHQSPIKHPAEPCFVGKSLRIIQNLSRRSSDRHALPHAISLAVLSVRNDTNDAPRRMPSFVHS
jgi:hypothetical protein